MTRKTKKSIADWKMHEDYAASLYQALGYTVVSNINIDGKECDLICEKWTPGAGKTVVYVDCKHTQSDSKSSVSNNQVDQFINNFKTRKDAQGWTHGVLLANKTFSQYAKTAALKHHYISLKTISELEEELFGIRPYLHNIISSTDNDKLFDDYVPLLATSVTQTGDPSGPSVSIYDETNRWLTKPGLQLCILGDFGSGKTTFMRFLHYMLAKQYLAGQAQRMPLLLSLRDYGDITDGIDLIRQFSSQELKAKVPERVFLKFLSQGRFLLLLDGFDEMGRASDRATRQRNYYHICQLSSGDSKTIVSCRPAYFVNHKELMETVLLMNNQIGKPPPYTRGDRKTIEKNVSLTVHLQDELSLPELSVLTESVKRTSETTKLLSINLFSDDQIRAYIKKHEDTIARLSDGDFDGDSLLAQISEIYDLTDLAQRPILLKLIVNTLPKFRRNAANNYQVQADDRTIEVKAITPYILYHVYTEEEFTREYRKRDVRWLIDRQSKADFVSKLAYHMLEQGITVIGHDALSMLVKNAFQPSEHDLEAYVTDIRACSFLVRDRNDNLRFSHKSFLEYFAARHLLPKLANTTSARPALSSFVFPEEVLYFLGDGVASFSEASIFALRELETRLASKDTEPNVCRHNILNLLNYARAPQPELSSINVAGLIYLKHTLSKLEITNSRIEEFRVRRSRIQHLRIGASKVGTLTIESTSDTNCEFTQAQVDSLHIINSTVRPLIVESSIADFSTSETKCIHGQVESSRITFGASRGSDMSGTTFRRCIIFVSEPKGIDCWARAEFDNCIFIDVEFETHPPRTVAFKNCVFIRCKAAQDLEFNAFAGCRGYFLREESSKKIPTDGRHPAVFSPEEAKRASRTLEEIHGRDASDTHRQRMNALNRMSWVEVLTLAFPVRGSPGKTLNTEEIWDRLKKIETDRSTFNPPSSKNFNS